MQVAIYVRISTDPTKMQDTGKNFRKQTEENQLIDLRRFCEKEGHIIYKEYVDQISGGTKDRPAFKELFQDAYRRKFDMVLFWSLDRFSREGVLKTLKYFEELESYKVQWKSYSEQYLDSVGIFKDVVVAIMATIAKQEKIRMGERVKSGIARKLEKGGRHGRVKKTVDEKYFIKCWNRGFTIGALCKEFNLSNVTVCRLRDELMKQQKIEYIQACDKAITARDLNREKQLENARSLGKFD